MGNGNTETRDRRTTDKYLSIKATLINGKSITVILRNAVRRMFMGEEAMVGVEVNKSGDNVTGKQFGRRIRIIQVSTIVWSKEMVMNARYGELVAHDYDYEQERAKLIAEKKRLFGTAYRG